MVIGILEAINPIQKESFDEMDIEIFKAFSTLAAIAIDKIQTAKTKLKQKRIEYDLEIANQIQQNFLTTPPVLENRPPIFARNIPAREIGGDFYDFFYITPRKLAVVIGDVAGKGISAALYMVKLLSDFRWHAMYLPDMQTAFRRVNTIFYQSNNNSMFATIIYLTYDIDTGIIEYINGGHLPFIIKNSTTGDIDIITDGKCPPLGVFEDIDPLSGKRTLLPDERIIMITDGVAEATNNEGDEYGFEKFTQLIKTNNDLNIGEEIFKDIESFSYKEEAQDDITVVTF